MSPQPHALTNLSDLKLESPACLFCGNPKHRPFDSLDGWDLVKCTACDFVFTCPRPTPDALAEFYDNEYFEDGQSFDQSNLSTIPENRILDVEQYLDARGRVLEMGPAAGILLSYLRQRGWEVTGVELSPDAAAFAKKTYGFDYFRGELVDYSDAQPFDAVIMYQSLEHVARPKQALEKAVSLLRSGGVLVVEVPNIGDWDLHRDIERKRGSYALPLHLSHFHHDYLRRVFEDLGLEVLEVNKYHANFVLRTLHRLHQWRRGRMAATPPATPASATPASADTADTADTAAKAATHPPMMRAPKGIQQKILKLLSHLFPGWRVTVIGRKR